MNRRGFLSVFGLAGAGSVLPHVRAPAPAAAPELTYRADGAWGEGKGAPLSAKELDANFHELAQRVRRLELDR